MSITNYLNKIKTAVYGRDVRGAIHDAIKECYDDASVNNDNANMEVKMARGTHNTLNDRLNKSDEIQAQTNAQLSQTINYVTYEMFGAIGDGVADDSLAIKKAHEYANKHGLTIKANGSKTYRIHTVDNIEVKTDVDWMGATFIIDDVGSTINRKNPVFRVVSDFNFEEMAEQPTFVLNRKSHKLKPLAGNGMLFVEVKNANKKQYIRKGNNANSGTPQQDHLIVDNDGNILTPVNWDFEAITSIRVRQIDKKVTTIKNGHFITISNDGYADNSYYERGIIIERDHVVVEKISHEIQGEKQGSPYNGFVHPTDCAFLTIRDINLSPLTFYTNSSGTSLGTYDIRLDRVLNVLIENIVAVTNESSKWGVFTSNYCKNIVIKNSYLNRVDAHEGVTNLTISNCFIGDKGVNVVGKGQLLFEHSTVSGCASLLILRSDFGSSWEGTIRIKDIDFIPGAITYAPKIINYVNDGTHDFGYDCFFPKLYVEDIRIDDTAIDPTLPAYGHIYLIDNDPSRVGTVTNDTYKYPLYMPSLLSYRNMTTKSGKGFKFAYHPHNLISQNNHEYSVIEECKTDTDGVLKRIHLKTNMTVILDNIQWGATSNITSTSSHLYHRLDGVTANDSYYSDDLCRVVPCFRISHCRGLRATTGGSICELHLDDCTISQMNGTGTGGSRMKGSATNCIFSCNVPSVMTVVKVNFMNFHFANCQFNKIIVDGLPTENMTKEDMWGCYAFLYYFKNKQEHFIHARVRMTGCYLHPSINLKVIEPNLDDFGFQFSNHNFEFYPRKRGYASYKPVEGEGYSIPVGTTYYVTSSGKFEIWNGNEWTDL